MNTLSACVAISMSVRADWHPDYAQQYLSCGCIALLLHPTGSLAKLSGNFFSLLLCRDKLILLLVKLVLKRTEQALPSNTTERGKHETTRSPTCSWAGLRTPGVLPAPARRFSFDSPKSELLLLALPGARR